MTVEEIFSKIAAHMAKGVAIHSQIINGFDFLNLRGYKKCHEYHFFEESKNYRYLLTFYTSHYYKIIAEENLENPQIIPQSWYKYTRMDVDINTKKNGIKELIKKWIDWEKETKKMWESSYKELCELNEVAAAIKIQYFIEDVANELRQAQEMLLNLEAMNYDMAQIISEQNSLYEEYKIKIENLYEDDDDD